MALRGTINGAAFDVKEPRPEALAAAFLFEHRGEPKAPEDEQALAGIRISSVYGQVTDRIVQEAEQTQKRRFVITISEEEMRRGRQEALKKYDLTAVVANHRAEARLLYDALVEVYERGGDPRKVYDARLAPREVPQMHWRSGLITYRTQEARSRLLKEVLAPTPDTSPLDPSIRASLEDQKLHAAVGAEVGQNDKTFRLYSEEQARLVANGNGSMPNAHHEYLETRRKAWWYAQYAQVQVTLSDPSFANRCGLARFGIVVPGSDTR